VPIKSCLINSLTEKPPFQSSYGCAEIEHAPNVKKLKWYEPRWTQVMQNTALINMKIAEISEFDSETTISDNTRIAYIYAAIGTVIILVMVFVIITGLKRRKWNNFSFFILCS
jgi:hypothetical protein